MKDEKIISELALLHDNMYNMYIYIRWKNEVRRKSYNLNPEI